MDRADYLTEKNRDALDAWLDRLAFGKPPPDLRTGAQRRAWQDIEWQASQLRAWIDARKRTFDETAERIAARMSPRPLCRVITFPARRSR